MTRPRVLQVVQRDDSATGGAVRVAFEIGRRLPDHGIDAHLLFLYGKEEGPFGKHLGDRAHYLRIKGSHRVDQLGRLKRFIQEFRPDLVHFHDDLLWPQLLNQFPRDWKTVVHAHGGGTPAPQPWKTRALYALHRRHAARVVCITEEAKASQQVNVGIEANKLVVIHNGIDHTIYRPGSRLDKVRARQYLRLPEEKIVIGFVGRLHDAMKGCLDFVDLLSRMSDKYVGVVVGAGPDADAMKARQNELGVKDRLFYTGSIDDTAPAYRAMDVFCFLSRYEPFGLALAEAMASGVPVVGFTCPGGSGELLKDETGFVIPDRDLAQMGRAISVASRSGSTTVARIAAARRLLRDKYDWNQSVALLSDMYEALWTR